MHAHSNHPHTVVVVCLSLILIVPFRTEQCVAQNEREPKQKKTNQQPTNQPQPKKGGERHTHKHTLYATLPHSRMKIHKICVWGQQDMQIPNVKTINLFVNTMCRAIYSDVSPEGEDRFHD